MNDHTRDELPFRKLGEFRILRVIGRGATGTVYEAVQESLGRHVAVKVLSSTFNLDGKTVKRFHREAAALARLQHRNIVPIFHVAKDKGVHFYAMELVGGEDVQSLVRRGPLDPRHAARLVRDVARALHVAHEQGIIHRDIKPANLILERDGEVKITDFGLAKFEKGATITESGTLVGTPMYMSPEQALGTTRDVGRRSDVYSLGATLYEMLTGRPLFDSENFQAILRMIVEADPVPPRRLQPRIPRDLETVVLRAVHKEPARRYATAREFAEDLDRFLEGEPILARRTGLLERGVRKIRRNKSRVLVGLLLVLIAAIVLWATRGSRLSRYELAVRKGRIEFYLRNLDTAIAQFRLAQEAMPDNPEAYMWEGKTLEESDDLEGAARALDRSVALAHGQAEPLLARARFLLRCGRVEEARSDLVRVLDEVDPDNAVAMAQLAKILFWYSSKTDPQAEGRALGLTRKVLGRQDVDRAARIEALRVAGMIHLFREDLAKARHFLETAYELDPTDPETQQAYFKILEFQWATVDREKIVTWMNIVNPFRGGVFEVGRSLVGPVEEQINSLSSTVESATERAKSIWDNLFETRGGAGGSHRDLAELNDFLAKVPFHFETLMERAALFEEQGEYALAVKDYETAASYHAQQAQPLYRLALVFSRALDLKFRDLPRSLGYAKDAVAKEPDNTDCLNLLLDIYISLNDMDGARRFFSAFFARHPQHRDRARIERQLEIAPPNGGGGR